MPDGEHPLAGVKALALDMFGTVVDWRTSITDELDMWLERLCSRHLDPPVKHIIQTFDREDTGSMAQEWRARYFLYCRSFAGQPAPAPAWRPVEAHLRSCLPEVLGTRGLAALFTDAEMDAMAGAWQRLAPYGDARGGLQALAGEYMIATLSNASTETLQRLRAFGGLPLHVLVSAETFRAFKPAPAMYRGAAAALGLRPGEVAMVAAHLADLQAARACGMRTVYVERAGEEEWREDEERYREARTWVDVWIPMGEEGFLTLAQRLKP